jgi:hypothetical protein
MLRVFQGVESDSSGNLVLRYKDETKRERQFLIASGAADLTIAALIAQLNKMASPQHFDAQPIRTVNVGMAAGADGSPGLAFHLAAGYVFSVFFPQNLIPAVRNALSEAERLSVRPPGTKPS